MTWRRRQYRSRPLRRPVEKPPVKAFADAGAEAGAGADGVRQEPRSKRAACRAAARRRFGVEKPSGHRKSWQGRRHGCALAKARGGRGDEPCGVRWSGFAGRAAWRSALRSGSGWCWAPGGPRARRRRRSKVCRVLASSTVGELEAQIDPGGAQTTCQAQYVSNRSLKAKANGRRRRRCPARLKIWARALRRDGDGRTSGSEPWRPSMSFASSPNSQGGSVLERRGNVYDVRV